MLKRKSKLQKTRSPMLRRPRLICPLKLLFVNSLCLVSCATQIPEIHPGITLPASGDGYMVDTLTGADQRIPKDQWQAMLPRGIVLFSDDWQTLKTTLLNNCMENTCAQAVGAVDSLFQAVDQALQKLPSASSYLNDSSIAERDTD